MVLERLMGEIKRVETFPKVEPIKEPISEPVPPEELKSALESILVEVKEPIQETPQEINFANLFEFVDWYEKNRSGFSEEQSKALNTLVQTRDMVGVGCPCRRPQRERAASEYFKTFWENNSKTDLITTLIKVAGINKVSFGGFLSYPS